MSSPGGGGINLPPLNQQINVGVNGAGSAQGMFNNVIRGAGGASSAVGGLSSAVGGMNRSMMNTVPTWRGAGDAMRMTGSLMMYKVAMPLIKIGSGAIKASMEFETAMTKIKGLVGVGAADVKKMGDAILNMAGAVGKAPTELADALYYITSAGIKDTKVALDTLDVSARAASAGLGTVKSVADLTTSVMNSYAPGMYDAKIATDALVAAVREGKAAAADFAPAMGKVLPIAAAFGVKFQDVAASVAALTRQGTPAGTAAIQLRQILGSLLKPTAEASAELEKAGLSTGKLRETIQNEGLFAGFTQLHQALGDNATAMAHVFGNIRPLTAISALLGPSMAKNALIFREIGASSGDADKAFKEMQNTLGFKMNAASAEGKVALTRIGDAISPIIKTLADLGKGAASAFAFFARNDWLVRTAAGFAGAAIGMTIFIRSLATFIRLKAFTTVALQGLANGFRDQTTGMYTNILTGKSWSNTMATVGTTASTTGAVVAASSGSFGALEVTVGQLTAYIVELMAVMTENSLVTAENTMMNEQLIVAQGGVATAITATTADVLAGDTALNAWAASAMSASGATSSLTGAAAAAGPAATGAATGVGAVAATAAAANPPLITMGQTLRKNIEALLVTRGVATNAAGGFTWLQMSVGAAKLAFQAFAATMGKAMLTMGGMMIAMMAVTWAIGKAVSMFHNMNKPVETATSTIRKLKDELSNFRVAPLTIGVNVEYNYAAGGISNGSGNSADAFKNFILPKDEKGKLTKDAEIRRKEMDKITNNKGSMSGADRMSGAMARAGEFAGDAKTRAPAIDFYATLYGVNKEELDKNLKDAETDGTKLIQARIKQGFEDAQTSKSGGGYLRATSNSGDIGKYVARIKKEYKTKDAARKTLESDFNSNAGITQPLTDSLSTTDGSALQFVQTLQTVSNSVKAAGGDTKDAEVATVEYTRAAIKAAGGNTKGATVLELLKNNTSLYGSKIMDLTAGIADNTKIVGDNEKGLHASDISTENFLTTWQKTSSVINTAGVDIADISTQVAGLTSAFDGGLNPAVQAAADLMDAYQGALKSVKRGQDALFGSQMALIDAQSGYGSAVSSTLQALGKSGGQYSNGTAEALKSQKELAGLAQSIMDVGNATYANTDGSPEKRAAAAAAAAGQAYDAAEKALQSRGGMKGGLSDILNKALGGDANGGIKFSKDWINKTFSQDNIDTTQVPHGAQNVGDAVPAGVAKGVTEAEQKVKDAAVASAQAIIDAYKEKLGIKSPSSVMRDRVGIPIVEGVTKGIVDGTPFAIKAAGQLSKDIWSAMDSATQMSTYQTAGGTAVSNAFRIVNNDAREKAAAAAAAAAAGAPPDNIYTNIAGSSSATGKESKADKKARLAAAVKLQGKKVSTGVYDIMATNTKGQDAVAIAKIGGKTLAKWAEGVIAAKQAVKTPVTNLIKEVLSEATEKLGKITALIDAKLNLETAKTDLKKFIVLNTTEMLQASVSAATRAKNQAANKFGGNQGTDVTKYEKSQIKTAAAAAQQAARDYRLGKISFTEYQDAQDALVNTQDAAKEASSEVASTTNDLTDALSAQDTAALRAAQAGLAVITAQDALTTAYANAKIGGQELKDLLASLSKDVLGPLTATTLPGFSAAVVGAFTNIVNQSPASMGLSPAVTALIPAAQTETAAASITNTPTSALAVADNPQMSRALARADFLAERNKALKTNYKTVNAYIAGGATPARDAARQALWEKYVKDNNVAAAAKGGSLSPGRLTLVGESGPELITPNSAARITPYSVLEQYARTASHNGSQGGSQGSSNPINITVHNPVPERASDSIARRMQNMSSLGLFG
jgi:TP901 family phage tail tape measure protein